MNSYIASFNKVVKPYMSVLDKSSSSYNVWIATPIFIFLIAYSSLVAPKLPKPIASSPAWGWLYRVWTTSVLLALLLYRLCG